MTLEREVKNGFTILAAAVAWFGVLLQLFLSLRLSLASGNTVAEGLIAYFGYFTILTNILVALVLTVPRAAPTSSAGRFLARPSVRTATAAAIIIVGGAYFLLLRNVWDPQGWQLVADSLLHYVTPALFLVHWWIAVPKQGLRWTQVPLWTIYPVGYLVYLLIRGELIGLYPYHFLDVGALGYRETFANALGVLFGYVFVAMLLLAAARWKRELAQAPGEE